MGRLVPSVQKAVRVLDLLANNAPSSLSLKDVATQLGLPRSTALGICVTLTEEGMLSREDDGSYRLGPHTVTLASRYLSVPDPILSLDDALNVVPELRDATIVISVLDGADVVYVACRTGTQPIALQYRVGMRLPSYCAAGGKALLSSLEPEDVAKRLKGADLQVLSSGKRRTLKDLTKEFTTIRENGYATDNEEVALGMCCVGSAIPRPTGHPLAAVSVSWVKAGVDSGTTALYADAIKRLAKQLSVRWE